MSTIMEPVQPVVGLSPSLPIDASRSLHLSVSVFDGIVALHRFAREIDRLNLASVRPNPFLSSAFLICYSLRIEYHTPGEEERLFVFRDGDEIVGCAPMRRTMETFGPALGPLRFRAARYRLLAPLDTEQPGILCARGYEEHVSTALVQYIRGREKGWGLLEFVGQRPGSALHRVMHGAANRRYRSRDIEVEPYNEIPIEWNDLERYFRSLVKKMRSNISRQARRLFAAGETELVLAEGSEATTAWFDAYCELDSSSWKHGTEASIQRHRRRVGFYREIASGHGGLDPSFIGVVLDGVLIAGLLIGSNATASPRDHGAWCLEMAYDQSQADLGPGQLLLLLAVGEAIQRGDEHLNFMQNFSYYKHRWRAEPIKVVAVQLVRRLSLHGVKAALGDFKKRRAAARAESTQDAATGQAGAELLNAEHGHAEQANGGHADRAREPTADSSQRLPAGTYRPDARRLASVAFNLAGNGMRRLGRVEAQAYLPFDLE